MAQLHRVRDQLLKNAAIKPGETLLDVGCGDGLIAFGALDRVGQTGRVIFSDVSAPLLEHCQRIAENGGVLDRCQFVEASVEDLSAIPDASVDVVTTRSVLIYVKDKAAAFSEFQRVLRPAGRAAIFEPINRFGPMYEPDRWPLHDIPAVSELGRRLREFYEGLQPLDSDPMMDFDQHDLLRFAEAAGFRNVHLTYHVVAVPAPPMNWEAMINAPGNPNIPSVAEAMRELFDDGERTRIEQHWRPIVEAGGRISRNAVAYLTARKAE
jgi:ubiquinone/menaquinone biosynthesis C-methylase UbiE